MLKLNAKTKMRVHRIDVLAFFIAKQLTSLDKNGFNPSNITG